MVIHGRSRIVEEENAQDNGVHMGKYKPFYTITNKILSYSIERFSKIRWITAASNLEVKPHLRRNNRIKLLYSSLKIEVNFLTLGQVRDAISGKVVLGKKKEIQKVKSSYWIFLPDNILLYE